MKNIAPMIILAAMCSVGGCAQAGKTLVNKVADAAAKGVQTFKVSDAEVVAYADEYMKWKDADNPLCTAGSYDREMRAVAARLEKITSAIPAKLAKELNLRIRAYYVANVNAFSCANGDIRIFAGLMKCMTDDEVLAIIGHEVGHVANKDSKNAFVLAIRIAVLKDAVGSIGGKIGEQLTNSQLATIAEELGKARYSQKQEINADAYGYSFLKKCGKDPAKMASALGVLLRLQEEAGSRPNNGYENLFASHPDLKKRIEKLNNKQ